MATGSRMAIASTKLLGVERGAAGPETRAPGESLVQGLRRLARAVDVLDVDRAGGRRSTVDPADDVVGRDDLSTEGCAEAEHRAQAEHGEEDA